MACGLGRIRAAGPGRTACRVSYTAAGVVGHDRRCQDATGHRASRMAQQMVSCGTAGIRGPGRTVLALADWGRVYVLYTDRIVQVRAPACRVGRLPCLRRVG